MASWTFARTRQGYLNLWRRMAIKPGDDDRNATRFAQAIVAAETRYRRVERLTGVPWEFIGALHMRESSCRFDGVLHNGERIIGKGVKTRMVPAGRGPFATWEESAVDALRFKGLDKVRDWSIARVGFEAERYNGLGYAGKGVASPYVWAGSTIEQRGKYVRDHVWDANFDDPQIGVLTVIKRLTEVRDDVAARFAERAEIVGDPPAPEPSRPANPVAVEIAVAEAQKPLTQSGTANAAAGGGVTVTLAGIAASIWDGLKDAPDSLIALIGSAAARPSFWIALAAAAVFGFIWWRRYLAKVPT